MRVTLVSEGSSDQALIPIIRWTLQQAGVQSDMEIQWADFRGIPRKPTGLDQKIRLANELFPCDLLIVHRDSNGVGRDARLMEISQAVGLLQLTVPYACLVPIKMLEAWLLFDEHAIRSAAGNPYGRIQLNIPNAAAVERNADAKGTLFELLRVASELTGRRLQKFDRNRARAQVAEYIDDFSPLRKLEGFRLFEADIKQTLSVVSKNN